MTDAMTDPRLMRLRVELYAAAQILEGEDSVEFWRLLDEIQSIRPTVKRMT